MGQIRTLHHIYPVEISYYLCCYRCHLDQIGRFATLVYRDASARKRKASDIVPVRYGGVEVHVGCTLQKPDSDQIFFRQIYNMR